jgi:hypothetical protein
MVEEWKAIVGRMPAGWFGRESFGLLTAYLRHWANAKIIAEQIENFLPEWLESDEGLNRFDQLSKVLEREQRALSSLAGKMRLSQSSRTKPGFVTTAIARDPGVRPPWDFGKPIE